MRETDSGLVRDSCSIYVESLYLYKREIEILVIGVSSPHHSRLWEQGEDNYVVIGKIREHKVKSSWTPIYKKSETNIYP